uniref:Uncharacterized protein n=1 Tax=Kalanchoe fedtschenkoi TaxID=63787 RepID=A0A7N0T648_KALFE
MRIRVQYRKFIRPSASPQARLKTIKLSLIDQQVQPVYVPILLYYKAPESSTSVSDCKDETREKLINLLEGSLSQALSLFYPLAGRFGEDGLSIDCNDRGVEYLVAQVDGLLSQMVEHGKQSADVHPELLNALVPAGPDVADHSGPLARIQVNTFECGGLVLAIQVAHKLADAFSIIAFVLGWATACRVGTLAEVTSPAYELLSPPSMEPRANLPQLKEPSRPPMGSGLVTRRFVFDQKAIMRLKNLVSSEKNRGASKVGIAMAAIWRSLIDVWRSEHRYTRPSMVIFPVNMRGKSSCCLQVPGNLCRNFLHLAFTVCYKPPEDVNCCVLDDLLNAINDAKAGAVKAFEKQISGMDLITGGINLEGEVDTVVMTSWCNFRIYEADFGWGKPEWVSSVRKRTPGVILMDSKCGEGVEAWVGLSGEAMLLFQNQPHILLSTC